MWRNADSNTRDVMSNAVIARGYLARSIKKLWESCNVALKAAAAALRVGCDGGEGARCTDEILTIRLSAAQVNTENGNGLSRPSHKCYLRAAQASSKPAGPRSGSERSGEP